MLSLARVVDWFCKVANPFRTRTYPTSAKISSDGRRPSDRWTTGR